MKKTTTLCGNQIGTVFFAAGISLFFSLGTSRPGVGQVLADTSFHADTVSSEMVQVIKKGGKLTAFIYLKNGQMVELNDSLSRSFISQSFVSEQQPGAYTFAEQMPSFPGGENAMMQYLSSHTHYPQRARENNIQGTVIVQFVVCTDGKLRGIKTLGKNVGWDLENEAIRTVKEMPDWIPGKLDGQPVNVMYSLPVRFVLSGKKFSIHYENKGLVKWIGLYLSRRTIY